MILVTGATGVSGSLIIREFARQNAQVRALVRNSAKVRAIEAFPTVEVVEGNMLQPETLGAALDNVDRVLMISSAGERMLETQCTFIDSARKAGVRHIVKLSGRGAGVGSNIKPFRTVRLHNEVEQYLEGSGLAWTHLRPSQFMQFYFPGATAMNLTANMLSLPMENARLAPVDIEDIAKIAFALLHSEGHEGKSYEITGPEALTMAEVAKQISQVTGRTVEYVNITLEEYRRAMLAVGAPPERADGFVELWSDRRRGNAESKVDLGTHETFGVHPTTFAEFVHRTAAVFRGESMP
ncbi:SDR family oxidoreductase [Ktedonospora formicarum]|uniref:NAD(P)-dependent oxidoreductase n=1 Tax=Ktedonospora formicarum TaxID=2778364 RepID=A0A8J3HW16_9CHLR|nr:SDR family oxidoreductase [Ktedonospora formicarum]GHO42045.1 NAD(P)-dependent oxidoreductase [Ktedonospora formicarum]